MDSSKNYRKISVYPSAKEVTHSSSYSRLPYNITKGPYGSTYEYLNTQFSLLREDFIKPLRESLISFRQNPDTRLVNIEIHEGQFIRRGVKKSDTCLCFEIRKGVTYNVWPLNKDQKRFMTGSLVIFSKDNFKTIFCGRVADSRNILYKKLLVSFEDSIHLLEFDESYVMIECNTFFEPYFHVLKVLKTITHDSLSMRKYLVDANRSVGMPKYLDGIKRTILEQNLNESQLKAMNAALSQELVIIQGPPGTGKTFLGLKIAKELLTLSKKWYDETPMLILSYTNHALDQFLEGLTDSTDRILRYGAQSKSPKMKNYSLPECRSRYYKSSLAARSSKFKLVPLYKEHKELEEEIISIGNQIDYISINKPTCIFNFDLLATGVPSLKNFCLNENDQIVSWLLEENVKNRRLTGCESPDVQKILRMYENYFRDSLKGSKYCMMSVSIIFNVTQKLHGKITDIINGITMKIQKYASGEIPRRVKKHLKEKKKEVELLIDDYNYLSRKLEYLKMCLSQDFNNNVEKDKINMESPFQMPISQRWQLYKYWINSYETYLKERIDSLIVEYIPVYEAFNKVQEENTLELMKYQKIIGITTTSAARLHSTIKALKCPIVIVEEAAEVLEAHILPVLTEHCQHLILIGDHKQLKPSTADHEINFRHKLGVSMFERMVLNDIQCNTLNVQHRMRPEISSLITPSIYPVLHNAESVQNFPRIRGVDKCIYFITHNHYEERSGYTSKKNVHEAKFLISLADYLLKNEYQPEEITILSAYLGQVGCLIREQNESQSDEVKKIKITSVDNFQGEENKIILLSLVRNNNRKEIGFLSIENRVCVALSRAKEGLYIMGNMEQLSERSQLWQTIRRSLESQEALGTSLPLRCKQHNEISEVITAEDFSDLVPDGGCKNTCNQNLSCGHKCQRRCHNDDLAHSQYECTEPCSRSVCREHSSKCGKLCYQSCGPCMYPLSRQLECGHNVKCFMEDIEDYRCLELLRFRLLCGHRKLISCNEVDSDSEEYSVCTICSNTPKEKSTTEDSDDEDLDEIVAYTRNINLKDSSDEEFDFEIEIPAQIEKPGDASQKKVGAPTNIRFITRNSLTSDTGEASEEELYNSRHYDI